MTRPASRRKPRSPALTGPGSPFQLGAALADSNGARPHLTHAAERLLRQRIAGVVARRPEAMVKISGCAKGRAHVAEHLAYITRNGSLPAERGGIETILGAASVRELADEWWAMRGEHRAANARDTVNLVLSMPAGTDRPALATAAREFARATFGGRYDYVLVHHADTPHPHAHLTVRTRSWTGELLNPRKADLHRWREQFAARLRAQGVAAEATPRHIRGACTKATPQSLRHMGRRSRVARARIEAAINAARGRGGHTGVAAHEAEPWQRSMEARRDHTVAQWLGIAAALDARGQERLAARVRQFAAAIPLPSTRQQQLEAAAAQWIAARALATSAAGQRPAPGRERTRAPRELQR